MSDTPRTDAIIAAADACPETRVVFLIHQLANLAKDLERRLAGKSADNAGPLEFDKCPDGKPCRQTTTGCLKGQCLGRVDGSSTPPMATEVSSTGTHKWDKDGERCVRCGDKDWMASTACRPRNRAVERESVGDQS